MLLSVITLIKIRIFFNTLSEILMQELFIELMVYIKQQAKSSEALKIQ